MVSPPAWGRGLKLFITGISGHLIKSPPAWGRGLKHVTVPKEESGEIVAPRVGAWIETRIKLPIMAIRGVAPRVGAWIETMVNIPIYSSAAVAPRVGAWIETHFHPASIQYPYQVAPRVGAWIETNRVGGKVVFFGVAPRVGAWIET